jgi:hypothetical protein
MAQGVQNQGLSEQTNMQNYGLNLNQQNLNASALQNTALNQSMTLAEQQRQAQLQAQANAAQLYGQSRIDPYAWVLSGTNNNAYGLLNTVYGTTTPSANAYLNYGQDLNNTNYNAQAAANISNANNQAGMNSGFISAGSNILGKFIGNMDTSVGGGKTGGSNTSTAGYTNNASTWVSSTGSPVLLQAPYEARTMNPACLKTGGGKRKTRSGKKKSMWFW